MPGDERERKKEKEERGRGWEGGRDRDRRRRGAVNVGSVWDEKYWKVEGRRDLVMNFSRKGETGVESLKPV